MYRHLSRTILSGSAVETITTPTIVTQDGYHRSPHRQHGHHQNLSPSLSCVFNVQQHLGRPSTPEFAGGESPVSPYQTGEADVGKGTPLSAEGREGEDSPGVGIHRPHYPPALYTPSYHVEETPLGSSTHLNVGLSQDNRHQPQPDQHCLQVDTLGAIPVNTTGLCPSPVPFPVLGQQGKTTKNEELKEGLINMNTNSLSPCVSPFQKDKNVLLPPPLRMETFHSQERLDPSIFPACFSFSPSCRLLPENERPQQSVPLQKHRDQEDNELPLRAENPHSQNRNECLSSFPNISSSSSYMQENDTRTATTFGDCLAVAKSSLPGNYATGHDPAGISHEELHFSLGSSYQMKNDMTMRSETLTNNTEDMKMFGEKEQQQEESKQGGQVLVQENEKNYQSTKIENDTNPLHSREGPPSRTGEKKGRRIMKNSVIYIDNHILKESCPTKLSSSLLPEPEEKRGRERERVVVRPGGPVAKYHIPTTVPGGDNYGDTRTAYVPKTDASEQPLPLYPSLEPDSQKRIPAEEVNPAVLRRKQQLLEIMKSQEQAEEKDQEEQEEAKRGKGEAQGIRVGHQPKQPQEQAETPTSLRTQVDHLLLRNTQAQAILEGMKYGATVDRRDADLRYQEKENDEETEEDKAGGEQGLESWEERFERKLLATGDYALCKQCDGIIKLSERKQERAGMTSAPLSLVQESHSIPREKNDDTEEEEDEGVFCRCPSSPLPSFPHSQLHPHSPTENTYEDSHSYTTAHKTLSYASRDETRSSMPSSPSSLDLGNKETCARKDLYDERSEREMPRIPQEKQVVCGDHKRNEKEKADLCLKVHRGTLLVYLVFSR